MVPRVVELNKGPRSRDSVIEMERLSPRYWHTYRTSPVLLVKRVTSNIFFYKLGIRNLVWKCSACSTLQTSDADLSGILGSTFLSISSLSGKENRVMGSLIDSRSIITVLLHLQRAFINMASIYIIAKGDTFSREHLNLFLALQNSI